MSGARRSDQDTAYTVLGQCLLDTTPETARRATRTVLWRVDRGLLDRAGAHVALDMLGLLPDETGAGDV